MKAEEGIEAGKHVRTTVSFFDELLADYHPRDFAVRLWDGSCIEPDAGQPARFTLVIRHPGALRKMFWPGDELSLGEAYIYDHCDIEGDIESIYLLARFLTGLRWTPSDRLRLGKYLLTLPSDGHANVGRQPARLSGERHSVERDRKAVTYHYNVSNEFYRLWLDERMIYSCAYFKTTEDDLDAAQLRKLDYICRKLRLRRGERLLDIGCGWGGLVIHAARALGVDAVGITLSRPQAELANQRIREAGLGDHCRVDVRDYREIEAPGTFDKLVSVGMFEHVGEALLPEYFKRAWQLLRPGGVFLNHGIAETWRGKKSRGRSFSDAYAFPDSELVPLSATVSAAETAGFEVRDVESLREHYALTLHHWVRRLEAHHEEARRATDEVTYRVWRLFMSGSGYRFGRGEHNVYQLLLSKPDRGVSGFPFTRDDWYH
jgi:cyclopropane-fatty-acyl-phospholipid synthase